MTMPITGPISSLAHHSRQELMKACLAEAARDPSTFTKLYPDSAWQASVHADAMRASGVDAGPLAGLPVSVKDLFDVAGETTLAGSIVLQDAPPAKTDAPAVRRLRMSGAAIIGKTNMTEFAFSGVGMNPHYGTPTNPADSTVDRIPGGSSSGAATSVARGMCAAALGTDTGGSIRIPAALCGLVGFKPTTRRVPRRGAVPLSTTLDTVCAMARSVDDCILLDSIIADEGLALPHLEMAGLRLAVPACSLLDGLDPQVAASFAAALSRLSRAGVRIIDLPLPQMDEAADINKFASVEAYAWHRTLLADRGDRYDSRVAQRMRLGASASAADYIGMHERRNDWIARVEAAISPFDALILPTVPITAPPVSELAASDEHFFKINSLLLRNPSTVNLLDGCAVSVPCHGAGTLPVGLMIAGPAMADARVLAVARIVEHCLARD